MPSKLHFNLSSGSLHLCFSLLLLTLQTDAYSRVHGPNGNGGGATVHGARARNSSIPLRSVLINQPQHQQDESQCEYCQPKECINEGEDSGEETDEYEELRSVFCYVERDKETGSTSQQTCTKSEPALRRLVVGDFADPNQLSGCRPSRKSAFKAVCWCKLEIGGIGGEDNSDQSKDLQNQRRLRFNSGRRGGLQVVRLQSAEDSNSKTEPLMGRTRVEAAPLVNASATPSAASKPIARPVIHTIPRRPSPANNGVDRIGFVWGFLVSGLVVLMERVG